MYRTCPIMHESKPYWTYRGVKPAWCRVILTSPRKHTTNNQLTHIQKKNAISKAFWKRMKWIKNRTISGRLNQKCSSDGLTTKSPSMATCFSATSRANWVITCSSLVPTASRSWKTKMQVKLGTNERKDL